MNPRMKTSKKWTAFPKEYLAQIEEVFTQGFKEQMKNSKLHVEGRIYPEEILLRVGILEQGRLRQANFEISMTYSPKAQDAVDRIYDCIDAAASMMGEYFEALKKDEEVDFPLSWKEYEFNSRPLFLQFSTVNSDLEAQADALLGENEDNLVHEQETEEAAENPDASEEKADKPSILGGKKKKNSLH